MIEIKRKKIAGDKMDTPKFCRVVSSIIALTIINGCGAAESNERSIVGYSSELTASPGDAIEFKVSAIGGGCYRCPPG
jgi:hypothetical protein